jgi:hypothetical protein
MSGGRLDGGRLLVVEILPDGGRVLEDSQTGVRTTACPFMYRDSPCASPVDRLWPSSCPIDYTSCSKYKGLMEVQV